jgi:exopolyphosphatase/pppGpp-phosphohydrolase
VCQVRLGVLDVGSNSVHPLVVDAHLGAHPTPMASEKVMLQLAELEGVSPGRAHQLVAGALVTETAMRAPRLSQLEICP